ncbi:MAG: MmgE/PrpD family protein, partial [Candidatus Methanolliviera hydrocarbonicum]
MSTERLAKFVVETSYGDLPSEGVRNAKQGITDCIGCALLGCKERESEIITGYAKERGGIPDAGIIGGGFKVPDSDAAWVNGTIAHALDYDDVSTSFLGHPSVALVPAVLALGEKYHLSGRDMLLAYITGFEVGTRVGESTAQQYILGWHGTSTVGSIAAAAASAKLLNLDVDETRMALGIVASLAGGLKENFGTMTKPLHAGNAARNGVIAATLAKRGFTAVLDILEAPQGYGKVFTGGQDCDFAPATKDLGEKFNIVSGLEIKPYPSCRGTHAAIDGTLYLRRENKFELSEIAEIECHGSDTLLTAVIYNRPKTGLEAKFSIEFCIALALLENEVTMRYFTDEKVRDPKIQEIISKIKFVPDPEAILLTPVEVVIKLKDGRVLSHETTVMKGEPENPMNQEELYTKYKDCASAILSPQNAEKSW